MSPSENGTSPEFHNDTTGDMNIGIQAGVVHGDVRVGIDAETPDEKARNAEKLLGKGMARDAERMFIDAIGQGCVGPRVAYYWALAILSGRSLEQVEADHLNNLEEAFRMVSEEPSDTWSEALRVVKELVSLLRTVDRQTASRPNGEAKALAAYDRLDPKRSAEIWRYLDQVLDGVVLEHLHQTAVREVAHERLKNDRVNRAWKFFEPVPTAPEWIPPPPKPRRLWAWLKLVAGFVLMIGAVIPLVPAMIRGGELAALGLALLVVGLAGLVHYGLQRQYVLDAREIEQRMFALPMEDGLPWKVEGQAKFVERMVAGAFNKFATSPEEKKSWKRATRRYRLNLTRQFFEVYQAPEVRRRPSVVRWLARWHAERLAERWDPERPDELCNLVRVRTRTLIGIAVGAVVTTVGAVLSWWPALITGQAVNYLLFSIIVASGVRVTIDQGCWLLSSARAFSKDVAFSNRRYQRELTRFEKLSEQLRDRPDDEEMASWLACDKYYLRSKAMELYQITNPELINHVTFSAPTEEARHMTAPGGPKRYTEYVVGIMLMTRGGVRMAEFHLDMCTGEDRDPERRSFRYEAIASVHVKTVRADRSHPWGRDSRKPGPAEQNQGSDSKEERPMEKPGYRTIFGIFLVNRTLAVEAIFDVFDDEIEDAQEEAHELVARALDVSGVAGALWMMEAITADGREWLQAQEARSSRRRYRSRQESGTEVAVISAADRVDEPVLT